MATTDFVVKNGLVVNQNLTVSGTTQFTNSVTAIGDISVQGSTTIGNQTTDTFTVNTSSLDTSAATFSLANANTTTLSIGGAATTLTLGNAASAQTISIGNASTGASTYNFGTGTTATGTTKTVNIGTGGTGTAVSNVNLGVSTGGAITMNNRLVSPKINIERNANTASGISWYQQSTYTAWCDYMAQAAQTNVGPTGNITAPSGTIVTSWAKRDFIENVANYGWTWESGTSASTTPSVVAEIRSSDGAARFAGNVSGDTLTSRVADGTAPLTVTSTTKVTNLNADLLDGLTTATANTASTVVARDASGNFSAGTITADLTGIASTATRVLSPDTRAVTTTPETLANPGVIFDFKENASNALSDGGLYHGLMTYRPYGSSTDWTGGPAYQLGFTANNNLWIRNGTNTTWGAWTKFYDTNDSATANTASTLVLRDGSGNFSAGTITAALSGNATTSTSTTFVTCRDVDRNAANTLPTTSPQAVRFDFSNAGTTGTGGNYAGTMTFAPYTGTTASTGDASYQLAFGSTAVNGGGIPKLNIRKGIDSTWNSWYTLIHSGNVERTTWNTYGHSIDLVAGQLAWKNYGNSHTIFDASNGTSPQGTAVNNSTPNVGWSATYPTLMGWNGTDTYGVRVNVAERLLGTEINAGATLTSGTVTGQWTLNAGSTWQATFADLAEWYSSDVDYEPGTVVVFGGEFETTISTTANDRRVAGVVSTNPAFIMNVDQPGPSACVALQGKVPVKVVGTVAKGDLLVTSNTPGVAMANNDAGPYTVIGKALENKTTTEQGVIYVSVGR